MNWRTISKTSFAAGPFIVKLKTIKIATFDLNPKPRWIVYESGAEWTMNYWDDLASAKAACEKVAADYVAKAALIAIDNW